MKNAEAQRKSRDMRGKIDEPAFTQDLWLRLSLIIPFLSINKQKLDEEQMSLFGEGERRSKGAKATFSRK